MYKKLGYYEDKKCFGDQVIVYKSEQNFFIVIKDREETVYFFVDNYLEKLYPVNSYMKKLGFVYNDKMQLINFPTIDLSFYGYSKCPEHLRETIKKMFNP